MERDTLISPLRDKWQHFFSQSFGYFIITIRKWWWLNRFEALLSILYFKVVYLFFKFILSQRIHKATESIKSVIHKSPYRKLCVNVKTFYWRMCGLAMEHKDWMPHKLRLLLPVESIWSWNQYRIKLNHIQCSLCSLNSTATIWTKSLYRFVLIGLTCVQRNILPLVLYLNLFHRLRWTKWIYKRNNFFRFPLLFLSPSIHRLDWYTLKDVKIEILDTIK